MPPRKRTLARRQYEGFYTIHEAAAKLAVNERTIRNYIAHRSADSAYGDEMSRGGSHHF